MLGYVFWHWKQPNVSVEEYEARQRAFHRALAVAPPEGFRGSSCHAMRGAPWAPGGKGADSYEDHYLVDSARDLDALNAGAVSASRAAPHDAAAAAAAGGTAGLYTLRSGGDSLLADVRVAYWFSKPDGMRYDALFELVDPLVRAGRTALWMRFMVLGPSPEFCLQSAEPIEIPAPIAARRIDLRSVC